MRFFSRALTSLAAVLCVLLIGGTPTAAQTLTTGSVGGVVTDQQGGVLPGATVTAVHTPTGTSYEGVTDAEGRFNILNVRVGPYDLKVVMSGFREELLKAVDVRLGENTAVTVKLIVATITETVEYRQLSRPMKAAAMASTPNPTRASPSRSRSRLGRRRRSFLMMISSLSHASRIRPIPTSRMLSRNGTRHPHDRNCSSGSEEKIENTAVDSSSPAGTPICGQLP